MGKSVITLPLLISALVSSAFAAPPTVQLPAAADPARVEDQVDDAQQQFNRTNARVPAAQEAEIQKQLSEVHFKLSSISLVGSTTETAKFNKRLQTLAAHQMGKDTTLLDVQKMAFHLQNYYREQGYVLTQVVLPPQKIDKERGNVQLRVYEGYVANVRATPTDARHWDHLNALQRGILNSKPLKIKDLERYVLLSNDIPGVTVMSSLEPSRTVGAADLRMRVVENKPNGYLSYNNRGTNFIGPRQLQGGVSFFSVYGADRLTLNFATVMPQPRQLRYLDVDYRNHYGPEGMQFHVNATSTKSQPGDTLRSLDLRGYSRRFQADLTYPIKRSRDENLLIMGGVYALNSQNDQRNPLPAAKVYDDRVRALIMQLAYDSTDKYKGTNNAKFTVNEGLSLFGANQRTDTTRPTSRAAGKARFLKFGLNASRVQSVFPQLSLLGAFSGMYGTQGLFASEQFGFGGANFGSAYDNSEITGDRGFAFKFEFQYDTFPNLIGLKWLQYYYGQDVGKVYVFDKVNQVNGQSAASRYMGFRYRILNNLDGSLELADPMSKAANQTGNNRFRWFFNVTGRL